MHLAPGTVIAGRYQLEAPIAEGGMGSVWRATHLQLRSHVAVKFMAPAIASSPRARERFEREARAAAKIQYVHIVSVQDFGIEGDIPFLVMELLRGESFEERLQKKFRVPLAELVPLVTQVAKGLRKAHDAGFVHRDLKPGNIFLVKTDDDDDEIVKIVDFGIAKQTGTPVDSSTKTGEFMGSPHYMSPEQIQDSKDIDLRSDLWSLGVIIFRALTGALPFPGDTVGAVLGKVLTAAVPMPSSYVRGLPEGTDTFFQRALARDRTARFQSAREMADAFAALAGIASSVGGGERRGSSAPWIQRDRLMAASAAPPEPGARASTPEPPPRERTSDPSSYVRPSQHGPAPAPSSPGVSPFSRQGKTVKMTPFQGPAPDPRPPREPSASQGPHGAGGRASTGPGTLTVSPSTGDAAGRAEGGRGLLHELKRQPLAVKLAVGGALVVVLLLMIVVVSTLSPDAGAGDARSASSSEASPSARGAQEASPAVGRSTADAQGPSAPAAPSSDPMAPPDSDLMPAPSAPTIPDIYAPRGGARGLGAAKPKDDALPKAPSDKGLVVVRSKGGSCSKVIINAVEYGSSPVVTATVSPGPVRVYCRKPSGGTESRADTVGAGQTREILIVF